MSSFLISAEKLPSLLNYRHVLTKVWTIARPRLFLLPACLLTASIASAAFGDQIGPPNLLKTMKTPFNCAGSSTAKEDSESSMNPIEFKVNSPLGRRALGDRLVQSRLYLPEKMVLGRVAEFTVKGKPGKWVALAMADKNEGSKPILGHHLRLGADRKAVALAQIPDSGIAQLLVETPIQGDLIGSNLYFEAAVWSAPDMHDVEIAQTVPTQGGYSTFNGVLIAPQFENKKGVKIVPTTTPFVARPSGLSSNQP